MKLTLIGLYNYDDSLFEGITLPDELDSDTLISNILMKGGEFEVTYPRPDVLKSCITAWSAKWQDTFTRWVEALAIDYAPLENYDRNEYWTDDKDYTETNDDTTTVNDTDNKTMSASSNASVTSSSTATDDSTTTNTRSAFDSSTYSNHDQTTYDDDSTLSTTETTNISNSQTDADTRVTSNVLDADKVGTDNNVHEGRVHGNIGVTTSQQMLQQELDIGYWNIYEHITDMFLREFTIPVYI